MRLHGEVFHGEVRIAPNVIGWSFGNFVAGVLFLPQTIDLDRLEYTFVLDGGERFDFWVIRQDDEGLVEFVSSQVMRHAARLVLDGAHTTSSLGPQLHSRN